VALLALAAPGKGKARDRQIELGDPQKIVAVSSPAISPRWKGPSEGLQSLREKPPGWFTATSHFGNRRKMSIDTTRNDYLRIHPVAYRTRWRLFLWSCILTAICSEAFYYCRYGCSHERPQGRVWNRMMRRNTPKTKKEIEEQ
jgi:hypothetical protein